MANTTQTANMNLQVPVVGTETSPQWATDINNCLTVIDGHDHSPGYGVQVTPAGLNINADLTLQSNNLTNARTLRFALQNSTPARTGDLGCLYESSTGDLYFIDGAGNNVRLTQSGSIVGTAGSITGLPSGTASVAYNSVAGSYVFQKATSTPALLDAGSILIRNNSASSKALTLNAPAAMAADIAQTLPTIPVAQNIMTMDSSGAMAAAWNVDGSTITVAADVLAVPTGGIGTTQLAASSVTTAKIADANVTKAKLTALGQQASTANTGTSTTSVTAVDIPNMSVTITTTGRPVMVALQPSASGAELSVATSAFFGVIYLVRDGTTIASWKCGSNSGSTAALYFPVNFNFIDTGATAASHTYKFQYSTTNGGGAFSVINIKTLAYEL